MKKLILLSFILMMGFSLSFISAANGNGSGALTNGSGSVVSTQNQGENTQLSVQTQLRSGNYMNSEGETMEIKSENGLSLKVKNIEAKSSLNLTQMQEQNKTRLHVQLSNGANAEVKIMPNTASETAIARLRLHQCNESNNCTIELKEVGSGEKIRAAYEVQAEKEVKVLGLFRAQMNVQTQIDAENGEVIQAKKPWWAFLAAE